MTCFRISPKKTYYIDILSTFEKVNRIAIYIMAPQTIVNHNYSLRTEPIGGFKSFESFYPFYLGEHCNKINRRLHFFGTTNSLIIIAYALSTKKLRIIPLAFLQGYIWAWIGHFFFEKNKPATFKYPLWSFMGDFRMYFEVMTLQRKP